MQFQIVGVQHLSEKAHMKESTSLPCGNTVYYQKHRCWHPQLITCMVKQRLNTCSSPSPQRRTFPDPTETPSLWQEAGWMGSLYKVLPNERISICKRQRGDSTEVSIQHSNTLAGIQVPDTDFVVNWGGEELQTGDIRVELNKARQKEMHLSRTGINYLACWH